MFGNSSTHVNVSNQYMYEVDSTGTQIWAYSDGPAKAFRYECDHAGLAVLLGADPCGLGTGINQIAETSINLYPNPSTGIVILEGISEVDLTILVYDVYGKLVTEVANQTSFDLSDQASGMYYVAIKQGNSNIINKKVTLVK